MTDNLQYENSDDAINKSQKDKIKAATRLPQLVSTSGHDKSDPFCIMRKGTLMSASGHKQT